MERKVGVLALLLLAAIPGQVELWVLGAQALELTQELQLPLAALLAWVSILLAVVVQLVRTSPRSSSGRDQIWNPQKHLYIRPHTNLRPPPQLLL